MLLILLAVHLLSRDSIAAPLLRPPDTRSTTDSCKDIDNCRTLFSVVSGCLATIFACTWVSVHPNVPPPDQNHLQLFWRRLKMMLIAMIAPEVMVGFAARQFLGSQWLVKEYKFSSTQAFYFCMGGFVWQTGHPIATKEQLEDPNLGLELQKAIQNVKEKDITDKSKGDALSKGVALLQGLWFILQCVARVHQHLAVTQLEVATLAFAVVNTFIWVLWWNKPLDAQQPIVIGPPAQPDTEIVTLPVQLPRWTQFFGAIGDNYGGKYKPLSSLSVPSFWSLNDDDAQGGAAIILFLVGTVFGAIHCAAWNAIFPTHREMWIWRTSALVITAMPGFTLLLGLMATTLHDRLKSESVERAVIEMITVITLVVNLTIYIAARIILIVLPLAELRSLPASAFVDVNWSTYIPHI
ncbi:hypothetical protein MSAN_00627800 [Mycena sanguinolenta]|uniref:Uncharacterized protein n=1 Tax=Mycena sanguinolenta TaxID=230812 RepID=A0A8H6Z3R7_9AGAR|nr:hypothetical protein MSAN_00627800 [Mycena sanguinolenta]